MFSRTAEQLLAELLEACQKSIDERLAEIESKLVTVETLASTFKEVSSKITSLEKRVRDLQDNLVDLKESSRRNNLIIFGVDARPDETPDRIFGTVVRHFFLIC